ncbi:MAG: hypothetical protein QOF80_1088 [Verrucomicrobiota bacterium]
MIWLGLALLLMVIAPVWEWRRRKMALEKEVAMLRWTVMVLGLASLLFAAQAQIRLDRLSTSNRELPAKPLFQQRSW